MGKPRSRRHAPVESSCRPARRLGEARSNRRACASFIVQCRGRAMNRPLSITKPAERGWAPAQTVVCPCDRMGPGIRRCTGGDKVVQARASRDERMPLSISPAHDRHRRRVQQDGEVARVKRICDGRHVGRDGHVDDCVPAARRVAAATDRRRAGCHPCSRWWSRATSCHRGRAARCRCRPST